MLHPAFSSRQYSIARDMLAGLFVTSLLLGCGGSVTAPPVTANSTPTSSPASQGTASPSSPSSAPSASPSAVPSNSAAGEIYVANNAGENNGTITAGDNGSITVYSANPSGVLNETPLATIAGSNTGLYFPEGVAVDATGKIYVLNNFINVSTDLRISSITVYAANPSGTLNEAPLATIAGSNTGLVNPISIALDASGEIYVANNGSSNLFLGGLPTPPSITVYAANPSGTLNEAPLATIAGSNVGTALNSGGGGIALDASGYIYVDGIGGNGTFDGLVNIFAANPSGTLNQAPLATIAGLNNPLGLAVAPNGKIYASETAWDGVADSIVVYAAYVSGILNQAPIATVTGANTGLDNPRGVAVDATGKIYAANDDYTANAFHSITVYAANPSGTLNQAPVATITGTNTGLNFPWGVAVH